MSKNIFRIILLISILLCGKHSFSQQRMEPGKMSYIYTNHPYCILYNDTLYSGSKEFRKLFYRTGNMPLVDLYKLHQSCKVWGNGIVYLGTIASIWGVATLSNKTTSSSQRTLGWISLLGGVGCDIGGEILILNGQKALATAVHLFNMKYSKKASVNLGVGDRAAGLVINW